MSRQYPYVKILEEFSVLWLHSSAWWFSGSWDVFFEMFFTKTDGIQLDRSEISTNLLENLGHHKPKKAFPFTFWGMLGYFMLSNGGAFSLAFTKTTVLTGKCKCG